MFQSECDAAAPEATAKMVNGSTEGQQAPISQNRKKVVVVGLGMVGIAFMYACPEKHAGSVLSMYSERS